MEAQRTNFVVGQSVGLLELLGWAPLRHTRFIQFTHIVMIEMGEAKFGIRTSIVKKFFDEFAHAKGFAPNETPSPWYNVKSTDIASYKVTSTTSLPPLTLIR